MWMPIGSESAWHHQKTTWMKHFRPPLMLAAHQATLGRKGLLKDRWCITTISASFATTKTFCSPRESFPPPGLSHMISNERQSEEGGKDAEWETLAACKGASQAATTDKRKVSFSRVDCWRNLARRRLTVYSELHVPYFMSALLSFRLLLEDL